MTAAEVVMDEQEALQRWCPFSRVALIEGMSANRTSSLGKGGYADIAEETRCLGSGCMAWRWTDIHNAQGQRIPMPQGNPDGCCGLAGKP